MNKDIQKIISFVVKDQWKFSTLEEAEAFYNNNIFHYNTYDEVWECVEKKDVEKYKNLYVKDKKEFYELYQSLSNSNCSGDLYSLDCMSTAIEMFEEK